MPIGIMGLLVVAMIRTVIVAAIMNGKLCRVAS